MAKLSILALALLALLALGHVSAFRASITTTVDEEENPRGQQESCREQMQRHQQLRQCQMYMSQQQQRRSNPQREQQLDECCQQLERMDEDCRCENLSEAVRQQQQQRREMRGEEKRRMEQMAEDLPQRCDLSPRRCQIRTAFI